MSLPRRAFVGKAFLAAFAVKIGFGATSASAFAPLLTQKPDDPAYLPASSLSKAAFEALVNTTFRIRYQAGYSRNLWLDTTLVAVDDLQMSAAQAEGGGECFRITLKSPARSGRVVSLPQGTYQVDSSTLGTFAILIVPGSTGSDGSRTYVAVFNHGGTMLSSPTRR